MSIGLGRDAIDVRRHPASLEAVGGLKLVDVGTGARLRALWELTKPGITRMVVVTAAAGFFLGSGGGLDLGVLCHTLLGIGLAAGGTNALNQIWERDIDALMPRTRGRPLPSGRLSLRESTAFAVSVSALGIVHLALVIGPAPALLVTLSLVSYVFLYTPLKKRTTLATFVGAIPGALPILAGWTAAGGRLDAAAWTLFGVLFLWQVPHFLALAWIYRKEYRAAGLASLSGSDPTGRRTARRATCFTGLLIPVSLLPAALGLTDAIYLLAALLLGLGLLVFSWRLARRCDDSRARALFLASVVYLPLWVLFLIVDRIL